MSIPNFVHRIAISVLFSIVNWKIIDVLLIELPFWKYFLIELSVLASVRLLVECYNRFELHDEEEEE